MELTDVPGVGAAKAERLQAAGIKTVRDLAEIDLRKKWDVNIGDDVLKRAKQNARKLCDEEGIAYAKASYGNGKKATKKATKSAASKSAAKTASSKTTGKTTATKPAGTTTRSTDTKAAEVESPSTNGATTKKRGFFARIFKRA